MYYHKVVTVFSKTASSAPYFLRVENTMSQDGPGRLSNQFQEILPNSVRHSWR